MKKNKKIILILLLTLAVLALGITTVKGTIDTSYYNPGTVSDVEAAKVTNMAGTILAFIRDIGIISSVIILTVIGLKYILASLEEKANYKENMIPYIVGCFLLAGATTIPSIIYDIMN